MYQDQVISVKMGDYNRRSLTEMKNDAVRFIRSYHRKNPNSKELNKKLENLQKIVGICGLDSQEMLILMNTFLKNMNRFNEVTFQSFLLCFVPEKMLERKMSCYLMEWLLEKYDDDGKNKNKCLILIKWFYSMLINNLILMEDFDIHFIFLFKIAQFPRYLNSMCPLLFILSSYNNTLAWVSVSLEQLKLTNPQNKLLSMLSKKMKMNAMKSPMSGDDLVWPYPAGLPAMNKILNMRHSHRQGVDTLAVNDILKSESSVPSGGLLPLAEVKTPDSFAHFFHIISLPHDIVTLLSSNIGVLKTVLDCDQEDLFISKLKFKLTDMFLSGNRVYKESECRSMLHYVYNFQNIIQQGIDCVSNFLTLYLRTWNGLDYKEDILKLCEWFVFDSKVTLLNDFLIPMHKLLLTSDVDDMKLYLEMYGKLYTNLLMESDKIINKNKTRMFLSLNPSTLKCKWMKDEGISQDVFSSLSKVIMQECRMVVQCTPSHKDVLLYYTLDLCLKCLIAEESFNKPLLTMIPQCAVALSLFSPSLQNIASVCFILDKYKQYWKSDRFYSLQNIYERELITIDGYIEDYINFLWRGTGWHERNTGVVFSDIETTGSQGLELPSRYSSKQLNSSLHCRNHIAIMTLAGRIMQDVGVRNSDLTDEKFLDTILQSLCPTLVSFIKKYREDSGEYMMPE